MLVKEAKLIGNILENIQSKYKRLTILNLGSSTDDFRKRQQPYISKYIFSHLDINVTRVVHVDLKDELGVDVVADITKTSDLDILREFPADVLLVSNLLEHVRSFEQTCLNLTKLMNDHTVLIITGPRKFPYHPDPIDNGWRPDVEDIRLAFPNLKVSAYQILESPNLQFATLDSNLVYKSIKYLVRLFKALLKGEDFVLIKTNFLTPVSAFCVELKKS